MLDLALQKLESLGYPFALWTLARLQAAFQERYGLHLSRSTLWVHGAFEPASGEATCLLSPRRDGATHIQLLAQMTTTFPAKRWLVIEDNLSIHKSRDVQAALLAWPEIHIHYLPTYAAWLNLIEPWWKQLRALALKGKRFENIDEMSAALIAALAYWNQHRHPCTWKKRPQCQPEILLGGYSASLKQHYLSI